MSRKGNSSGLPGLLPEKKDNMAVAVEMLNISKFFPGVVANDNVSLA